MKAKAKIAPRTVPLVGRRKAAVLLLSLDEDAATKLLQELEVEEAEAIEEEISRVGMIEAPMVAEVLGEFRDLVGIERILEQEGPEAAAERINETTSTARRAQLRRFVEACQVEETTIERTAEQIDRLVLTMQAETPQTIAVVLAHLESQDAAGLLLGLPDALRTDLLVRVASLQGTPTEVLLRLEANLERALCVKPFVEAESPRGGVKTAAEIIAATGPRSRVVLEELYQHDVELARNVARRMFRFDDIAQLDDKSLRALVRELDTAVMSTLVAIADRKLRSRMLSRLSKAETKALGVSETGELSLTMTEIERAQQAAVETVLRLEELEQVRIPNVRPSKR